MLTYFFFCKNPFLLPLFVYFNPPVPPLLSHAKLATFFLPLLFFAGEREQFSLPDDMPVVHFEYTQFYYPGDLDFPRE